MSVRVRSFLRDTRAAVLVWVAVMSLPLLAVAGLAIDVGRMFALYQQVQKAADAAAIAAGAELDRRADAITRANRAIANLVTNSQSFAANGRANVTVQSIRYLSSIPGNDTDAITAGNVTTDPLQARYVEVTVAPVNLPFLFPLVSYGGGLQAQAQATGVAGYSQAVCNYTPIFICNPFEGSATTIQQASSDPNQLRTVYALRRPPGSTYTPGNYGFLQPAGGPGAVEVRNGIAASSPPFCFVDQGAELRPGFISNAANAVNVRFDVWGGPYNNAKSNADYRPARSVVKGYVTSGGGGGGGSACNASFSATDARDMGPDVAPTGPSVTTPWNFAQYMDRNHWTVASGTATPAPVTIAGVTYAFNGVNPATPPSRYNVYRWEIDQNRVPNSTGYTVSTPRTVAGRTVGTRERGAPACYSGGGVSDNPDRRILYVAVINCNQYSSLMGSGSSGGEVPVEAFARMFLTKPVGSDDIIYGEFNGVVTPNQDGSVVRDIVRLVR